MSMNLIRLDPFREMQEMFRQYSPLLGRGLAPRGGDVTEWRPAADIVETDNEYLIKVELPEVRKEDVKITVQEGVLTVSGERRHEHEEKNENELRIECVYGTFTRSFVLPENSDTNAIRAEAKDGVLRVHIPKRQSAEPKPVTIQVQ